jgi:hypothetical protein
MKAAIDAVPYASAVKVGLQFKRRFWEEDERFTAASVTLICRSGKSPIQIRVLTTVAGAYCWELMLSGDRTHTNSHQCRPQKGLRGQSLWAHAFIRNTRPSLKTASRWLGIACHSRSDAPATGPKRLGQSITTACAKSMAGSCWPASTRHTFPHGKRVLSSHHSTPSLGCMIVSPKYNVM